MKTGFAPFGAILSILGLVAWLSLGEPGGSGAGEPLPTGSELATQAPAVPARQEGTGSAVPCVVPLPWRIARVDPGFGLTADEARGAVQQAAALWERALDRSLFSDDPTAGFPIRFVYDDRQAHTAERIRRQDEFAEEGERLEEERVALNDLGARYSLADTQYEDRLDAFEQQASSHNATVRDWNQRGDAPEALLAGLRSSGERLEVERLELKGRERELESLSRSFQDEEERLNREIDEHRRRGEALERAFPPKRIESGLYREALGKRDGEVVSVNREIDVYRFDDLNDLQLVVAHELGHSLGLGHATVPGAVMSEEYGGAVGSAGGRGIQPIDVDLFSIAVS